jgi:hypothetical protein
VHENLLGVTTLDSSLRWNDNADFALSLTIRAVVSESGLYPLETLPLAEG